MAIYHFSVQVISRSKGRSAVAAAAYRAGELLYDERYGKTHDYRKKNVAESVIVAPENAPDWVKDRARLWNAVEEAEKRKDAQLCREINLALPRELTVNQQRELLSDFVKDQFVKLGMIADVSIHRDNPDNPHAHIMLTTREITSEGFGKKVREWNEKELLETWRAEWANYVNRALERAGHADRIDHRSLEAQGSNRLPTIHEGPQVRQMERRGARTDRGNHNRNVAEHNAIVSLDAYRKEKEALANEAASAAVVEPTEGNEKQLAVLTAKAQELKAGLDNVQAELRRIQDRLSYYEAQQQRIDDRSEIARKIAMLQQSGRGLLGLYNKNSKEIAELQRKKENLEDRIREHSRYVPSDAEAAELRHKRDELEKQQKELAGQFHAVRNKGKSLQQQLAGQEKKEPQRDRSDQQQREPQQRVTLRQVIQSLKYSAKGVPVKGVPVNLPQADLDKPVQKVQFSNRGGVERLDYQLEGSDTKQTILFEQMHIGRDQRDLLFDQVIGVAGAILSSVDREKQREDFIRQQQMKKKKRRDMER
ncbi:MAG: MobQ family relaxase [Limisphaerales bacterium]